MLLFVYIFVYFLILTVSAKNEDNTGSKVYNIKFESNEQQEKLQELKDDLIDFWKIPSFTNDVVGKAMVPDSKLAWFEVKLSELEIKKDIFVDDVPKYLEQYEKNSKNGSNLSGNRAFSFDGYYRYDEILEYLYSLQETTTDSTIKVTVETFGETEQGRPLIYIKIQGDNNYVKPIVVIEAGINPREWITVSAAMNVVDKLMDTQRELLDKSDWIVIPVLNPDGYEYTYTNERLWTKTLSTKTDLGLICPGANINRNFDPNWRLFDSSSSPCSHIYSGIEPFSEIETQMIRHIIQTYRSQISLYISLQNNGGAGLISYPYQYERAASGMFRQHHLLALEMVDAMEEDYKVEVGYRALGDRISGTSTDYAQQNGVLYPFTIHIVESEDGVIIPDERIEDVIEDVWRAVEVAAARLL